MTRKYLSFNMTCIYHTESIPELKKLASDCLTALEVHIPQYEYYKFGQLYDMGDLLSKLKSSADRHMQDLHLIKSDIQKDEHDGNFNKDAPGSFNRSSDNSIFAVMKLESNRLASFQNKWTLSYVQPSALAAAGLFYLGVGDKVQCAFCRGIITDWSVGDDPLKEHICHFSMCPFLLGNEVGNIPLQSSHDLRTMQINRSFPECYNSSDRLSSDCLRTSSNSCAQYPAFNNVDKRLQTYSKWPPLHVFKPEQLAECGFFYTGASDTVTCFCCGGSLESWDADDDPWIEHAKHFSNCAYVRFIKGAGFIESVHIPPSQDVQSIPAGTSHAFSASECIPILAEDTSHKYSARNGYTSAKSEQENKYLCKICMEERPRVAFIPCGHSLACPGCARLLTSCPVCRKKIDSSVRIYFD